MALAGAVLVFMSCHMSIWSMHSECQERGCTLTWGAKPNEFPFDKDRVSHASAMGWCKAKVPSLGHALEQTGFGLHESLRAHVHTESVRRVVQLES